MTGRAERVIVGSSFWAVNGVNTFAASLTRALADAGTDASLLLTEANTRRVTITDPVMPLPAGVVHRVLPVRPWENWGAAWGSLVAELRGRAPCVWMPNADFRHSVVSPRLPDEVLIVGVVHGNDPLHFDHVERLGRYWNAVVAVNDGLGREVAHRHPELADRVVTIPPGVEVPALPRAPRLHRDGALRLLYVGSLVQHPKRILDFPPLIEHCLTIGLPVRLTVVGGGSDEPALRSASRTLIEQGSITLAGVVSPNRVPALLQEHDALLLMSDFEGTPNAVLEAMAQGCIPVVSATANDAGLVRDGWNGFVFPTGDIVAAAGALKRLLDAGPAGASQLADRGHATVRDGYSIESVAARYLDLFTALRRDVERGAFRRPSGELAPPPRRVGPDVIFPLEAPHHVPGVGRFPSADDAEDYEEHLTPPTDRARVKVTAPVVVSVQGWAWSGIHRRVHRMVRGLRLRGVDARILVTEAGAPCHPPVPLPDDVPVDTLPVLPDDSWGARWGATVRYFEDLAPQAWLPVTDWGHACIVPRVADRVRVIGMAWDDDPTCLEYLRWLAPYLNSVISMSRNARRMLRNTDQSFAAPIAVIPDGIDVGASLPLRSPDPDNRLRCLVLNPVEAIESTLSNIAAQLQTAGIDARYTIVGSSQRAETVLTTSVDYVTTPVPDSVLLDTDVVIVEGNGEWLPEPAWEAVAAGAAVILVGPPPAEPTLIRDGEHCVRVARWQDGTLGAVLANLVRDEDLRRALAREALGVAQRHVFRESEMIEMHLDVLERVIAEPALVEKAGPLLLPPTAVAGREVFPKLVHNEPGLGAFASAADADDYRDAIDRVPSTLMRRVMRAYATGERGTPSRHLRDARIVIGTPVWSDGGINRYSEALVRGLRSRGLHARLLLTEEGTDLVTSTDARLPRPSDVPFDELMVARNDGWGAHWGALVSYLTADGPCLYLPTFDYRHAGVLPQLPPSVHAVGWVWGNDAIVLEATRRLAPWWSAVMVGSRAMARVVRHQAPSLSEQIAVIHDGTRPDEHTLDACIALFDEVLLRAERGTFRRPAGELVPPVRSVNGVDIFPIELPTTVRGIGAFPSEKDGEDFIRFNSTSART